MKNRIKINQLVETVASGLPAKYINDLPAIRQALNDTADSYRKDGFTVSDGTQHLMVKHVREQMRTLPVA